ncbi:hypothetical protein ACWD3J_16415 [Streptomyces sp. NPDC002755]
MKIREVGTPKGWSVWAAACVDPDVEFVGTGMLSTETIVADLRPRAVTDLAEAGKPVMRGTLRWELAAPPTLERQSRTVDDPGTSVNGRRVDEVPG